RLLSSTLFPYTTLFRSPIAMASILYAFTIERIFFIDGVTSRCGGCGKIVSLYNNCPFSSKQTTLQPDLNPGSIANIRFSPNGARSEEHTSELQSRENIV